MANRAMVQIRRQIVRDTEGNAVGHRLQLEEFTDCKRCGGGPGPMGGNRADNPGSWHGGRLTYTVEFDPEHPGSPYRMNAGCDCVWGALWVWVGRGQGASAKYFDRMDAPPPPEPAPEAEYAYEDQF